ncbi:MAG: hypothetical protein WBD11_08590 [Xanthobacteraceae bacterium]|jgi:hypothetical protein
MGSILLIFTVLSLAKVWAAGALGATAGLNFYGSQDAPTSSADAKSARVNPNTNAAAGFGADPSAAMRSQLQILDRAAAQVRPQEQQAIEQRNESGQTIIAARDRRAIAILPAYVRDAPAPQHTSVFPGPKRLAAFCGFVLI